jgi:hypothetical protein
LYWCVASLVCITACDVLSISCWLSCRYGFIVYKTREAAEAAVETLAGQELEGFPGRKVNVRAKAALVAGGLFLCLLSSGCAGLSR